MSIDIEDSENKKILKSQSIEMMSVDSKGLRAKFSKLNSLNCDIYNELNPKHDIRRLHSNQSPDFIDPHTEIDNFVMAV